MSIEQLPPRPDALEGTDDLLQEPSDNIGYDDQTIPDYTDKTIWQPESDQLGSPDEQPALDLSVDESLLATQSIQRKIFHQHPLLSAAEEVKLAKRVERGDLEAKDIFIKSNLRLVASVARRYRDSGLEYDDMIQDGTIGLIRAVEKFDYRRGFKFSTYAENWIIQSITRGIQSSQYTIRLPYHMHNRLRKAEKAQNRLLQEDSRTQPDLETIAEAADVPVSNLAEAIASTKVSSLDAPIASPTGSRASDETNRFSFIADDAATAQEILESKELNQQIQKALAYLNDDQRTAVTLHSGLNPTGAEHTISDIAHIMHIRESSVRQIINSALNDLKAYLADQGTDELLSD